MQANRCPNCENDINEVVTSVVIAALQQGENGPTPIACPHCGQELIVRAAVQTSVER